MASYTTLLDGQYARGLYVGRPKIAWPFLVNGDRNSIVITREFRCRESTYQPAQLGIERDPAYADAFMMTESDPQPTGISDLISCTRTFARVPRDQTVPSSIVLTRPSLSGTFPQVYGSFRVFQPDTSLLRYDAYAAQTVTSDSGAPVLVPTGGTYTISFFATTTGAIAYNAAAATVEAALNAFTNISNRGFVTVTGSYTAGFTVTFATYAQISITSSLTSSGTVVTQTSKTNNGYTQSFLANTIGTVTAITANITGLTTNGAFQFVANYADGNMPYVTGSSHCIINANGGYYSITGGTFTLTINSLTTAPINWNADGVDIQEALDNMAPGSYRVEAWPQNTVNGSLYPAGYYDFGSTNAVIFSIAFIGGPVTGGTYTMTVGANTTAAIAHGADAATVSTALNLLTSVTNRGGCTVAGTLAAGFTISFSNPVFTANSTSLTPAASLATPLITDSAIGRTQSITLTATTSTRDLYVAAHGFATSDILFLKLTSGATYYSGVTSFSLPDANTIRLNILSSQAYAAASTISECGKRTRANYTPGTATLPSRRITSFYLPGYTLGIATSDDIEIPVNNSDGVNFLLAAFQGAGVLNWQVGELIQWQGSTILALTKTTINAADV